MTNAGSYTMKASRQTLFGVTEAEPSASLVFSHNYTEFARVEADGTVRCDIDKLKTYLADNPCPKPGHELMHSIMLLVQHAYKQGYHEGHCEGGYYAS